MPEPPVTIIWLNYNSMRIIELVRESLRAIADLDYDNFELVVVDNGSCDGSFEAIRSYIETLPRLRRVTRIVRLPRNLGFAGGVNAGFRARRRDSRYVVLLNNDAIPEPNSLRRLVEEMEARPKLGAAQGTILDLKSGRVASAGIYLTRQLFSIPYMRGCDPGRVKGPLYATYVDGAYSIWRVEAVLRATGSEKLFIDELFAYCDDSVLAMQLWSVGYRVAAYPFIAARHYGSLTFDTLSLGRAYYAVRCWSYLHRCLGLSLRDRLLVKLLFLRRVASTLVHNRRLLGEHIRAWRDGAKLARSIGCPSIRLERVPLLELPRGMLARLLLYRGLDYEEVWRLIEERYLVDKNAARGVSGRRAA